MNKEKIYQKIIYLLEMFGDTGNSEMWDEVNEYKYLFLTECSYMEMGDSPDNDMKNYMLTNNVANMLNTYADLVDVESSADAQKTANTMADYNSIYLNVEMEENNFNVCEHCGTNMKISVETSEILCPNQKCGIVKTMYNMIFDENQYYDQNVNPCKIKRHATIKHCDEWLKKIQAKVSVEIPDEIIEILNKKVVAEFRRKNINKSLHSLTCKKIRSWLNGCWWTPNRKRKKTSRLTDFNEYVPTLRKILTGIHGTMILPPQLSSQQEELMLGMFSRVMDVYDGIINTEEMLYKLRLNKEQSNKRYYPYFIYKLAEILFRNEKWLPDFLECIHLQNPKTLYRNDLIWQDICTSMGLEYIPTQKRKI